MKRKSHGIYVFKNPLQTETYIIEVGENGNGYKNFICFFKDGRITATLQDYISSFDWDYGKWPWREANQKEIDYLKDCVRLGGPAPATDWIKELPHIGISMQDSNEAINNYNLI
jgi:hypothetical protein